MVHHHLRAGGEHSGESDQPHEVPTSSATPRFSVRITRLERRPWPSMAVVGVLAIWSGVIGLFTLINSMTGERMTACLFKNATGGIPCPTCGATRLTLYTASGRFMSAFLQNPLVFAFFVCLFVWLVSAFVFRRKISVVMTKSIRRFVIWAIIVLAAANWAYVIIIDGPWTNDIKTAIATAQGQERGVYCFFAHESPPASD